MPRVNHVKKAQKDIPGTDIKKGDSYYWWKFRYGGKHCQKTYPKQSQLTQSEFWGTVHSITEDFSEVNCDNKDDFDQLKEDMKSRIEELRDNCQEKLDNMPEGLQQGSTGELLQERIDACESWADEIDGIECDYDENELREEAIDELNDEQGIRDEDDLRQDAIDELNDDGIEEPTEDEISDRMDDLRKTLSEDDIQDRVNEKIAEKINEALDELKNVETPSCG